jgi:hypothetical protein
MSGPFVSIPFNTAIAITPSDTAASSTGPGGNFVGPNRLGPFGSAVCESIFVGGAGDVVAVLENNIAITFAGATAGSVLPIRAVRVNSTNTTATAMDALYNGVSTVYTLARAITASDTVNFVDGVCDAIWVGSIGGGAVVRVVSQNGLTTDYTCVAGSILNVSAKRVNSTGTTASSLVAMYF